MPLELMEWSRPGTHLQYVVIFRSQSRDLEIPEQRYEGRVELKDRENGDVSLVLKNVTAEDGGTYQCYVKRDTDRMKRAIQPVSTVYLDVLPPPPLEDLDSRREEGENRDGGNKDEEQTRGNRGGSVTAIVAVVAACVVMAVIVSVMVVAAIRWKKIRNYRCSPQDEAETPQDNCLCNSIHPGSMTLH
ncbi:putative butyrophilin subfamily 2 member A3 [Cyprinodon tularosa]|uniref:putative butyrophilin subfamily 2 member A3 n=1 Tax=Cyprinodon tularosa TaxID=77115 RepID=UPI0018E247CD|nr:putative butyrophilin subfamily 2 member A3 [Cyprinodon tularosa]